MFEDEWGREGWGGEVGRGDSEGRGGGVERSREEEGVWRREEGERTGRGIGGGPDQEFLLQARGTRK